MVIQGKVYATANKFKLREVNSIQFLNKQQNQHSYAYAQWVLGNEKKKICVPS